MNHPEKSQKLHLIMQWKIEGRRGLRRQNVFASHQAMVWLVHDPAFPCSSGKNIMANIQFVLMNFIKYGRQRSLTGCGTRRRVFVHRINSIT